MRTRRSSAATLLLFVLHLITESSVSNGNVVRWKRSVPSKLQYVGANENYDDETEAQGKNSVPLIVDLQVDQSELVVMNMEDLKDVDNIEDALSLIEYEPQKIGTRKKKNSVPDSDSTVSSSQPSNITSPGIDITFYEIPQTAQPRKTIVTPYYPKSSFESVQTPKTSEVSYIYPVLPTNRQAKQRSSRLYPSVTPRPNSITEEQKPENTINSRIPGYQRSYSSSQNGLIRPRPFTPSTVTTAPSNDDTSSPLTVRRRKSRRHYEKPTKHQDASQDETTNYPIVGTPKARSTISIEDRRKIRRLVAKYDAAPRPFARSPVKTTQDNTSEKLTNESITSSRTRANSRNQLNVLKTEDKEFLNYPKVADSPKSPIANFNRRLYDRKGKRQRLNVQIIGNDNPQTTEETSKPIDYQSRTVTPVSFSTETSPKDRGNVKSVESYTYNSEAPARISSVTPSGLDAYQNVEAPVVNVHSDSLSSTSAPYASPASFSSKPIQHSSSSSTVGPAEIEVSSVDPWIPQRKDASGETDVEVGDTIGDGIDGVADATSFGSEELSKENEGKASYDMPEVDHYGLAGNGGKYGQSREDSGKSVEQRSGDDHGDGQKDDTNGEDTHVSSRKDERHQEAKGGAGHGGDAGGSSDEYEMGGKEERSAGHKQEDGKKGDKGYKSWHEHEKKNKGHHNKEKQTNYYDEEDGKEKKQDDEGGYHEERQQGEDSAKESEYDEKGEHQKGYSTKGQHSVHKKDEFEKRTEFFDDFHEDGETEDDGEFHQDHEMTKGGHFKKSHEDFKEEEGKHGKQSKYEKGKEVHENSGHKKSDGQDVYDSHEVAHGEKVSHEVKKSRSHSSGDDGKGSGGGSKSR